MGQLTAVRWRHLTVLVTPLLKTPPPPPPPEINDCRRKKLSLKVKKRRAMSTPFNTMIAIRLTSTVHLSFPSTGVHLLLSAHTADQPTIRP